MAAGFADIRNAARARLTYERANRIRQMLPDDVKQNQQVTEENAMKLRQAKEAEEAGKARGARLSKYIERLQNDDPMAMRDMAVEFPEEASARLDALAAERKASREAIDLALIATMRLAVAGSENPQDFPRMRQRVLEQHPTLTPEDIPERPSAAWLKSALAMGSTVAQLHKQAGFAQGNAFVTTGGESGEPGTKQNALVDRGTGEVVARPGPEQKPAPKGSGSGSGSGDGSDTVPSGISNSIIRATNDLFGDIIDPETREIKVLDPEKRQQALNVMARAEEHIAMGRENGALQAVKRAAEEADIDFRELGITTRDQRSPTGRSVRQPRTGRDPRDPASIREFLGTQ